jgi:hypothetical protein
MPKRRDGKEKVLVKGRNDKVNLTVTGKYGKEKLMLKVSSDCTQDDCNQFLLKNGTCSTRCLVR